jgi:hypothetical protein
MFFYNWLALKLTEDSACCHIDSFATYRLSNIYTLENAMGRHASTGRPMP